MKIYCIEFDGKLAKKTNFYITAPDAITIVALAFSFGVAIGLVISFVGSPNLAAPTICMGHI